MRFGEVIKARRKELRMTQDDLCANTDISKFKIVQIEKGENFSLVELLPSIGKALHLTTVADWQAVERKL